MTYLYSAERETEDSRTQIRRRLQQRRCLQCGARSLSPYGSYFCRAHIRTHRFCSLCETLRPTEEHGKDSRCKACAAARALECYYANTDRNVYRIRLKQIANRTTTRGDQILEAVRRRIWLAELVRQTPGMSWPKRAAMVGMNATQLAQSYRWQCSGQLRDVDASDRARDAHWRERCH